VICADTGGTPGYQAFRFGDQVTHAAVRLTRSVTALWRANGCSLRRLGRRGGCGQDAALDVEGCQRLGGFFLE